MFNLFTKVKKPEAACGPKDSISVEDIALRLFTSKYAFEVNTDFGGLKGWPGDVVVVSYFQEQGVLCAGTESGAMVVYGKNLQHFRPRATNEYTSVKNIVSVGIDMCLVIYSDSSLAVFKLPCLELLDTLSTNWMTNSDEFGEVDISCVHVDEYTEKNLKTFVYVGTDLGDVHVLDISPKGSIKICDYTISCPDVELSCQMRVTAILSDDKCLMVGYDKAGFVDDVDSNFESSSRCSSPRDTSLRFPNFSTEVREAPSPSKILGVVVVFNITKRRVRHSYPMGSGVSFLIWDSVGDSLYTVLRNGEIYSLTATSGKSLSTLIWSSSALAAKSKDGNGRNKFEETGNDDDEDQMVKRIRYIPPQTEINPNKYGGSFIVLLNSNSVVCLTPSGPHGELMEIMSFPHLESEDITDFLIVPTFQPNNRMKGISSKSFHTPHAMPALLFVTKGTSDKLYGNDGKVTGRCHDNVPALNMGKMLKGSNQLRTISCATAITTVPTISSGASAIDVAVAIAVAITEKEPTASTASRKVALPFESGQALSNCITALPPCVSPTSIATVLIAHPKVEKVSSEEVTPRDGNASSDATDLTFELVLASEDVGPKERSLHSSRFYDIVFLGQKDGLVSAWACYPAVEHNKGKHNRSYNCVWYHLRSFTTLDCIAAAAPNGRSSLASVFTLNPPDSESNDQHGDKSLGVTSLFVEEGSGLISAGTAGGDVVVWEAFQSSTARGYVIYTAGKGNWGGSQMSDCRIESSRDGTSSSKGLSPNKNTKIGKGTLFSWDEDEDEEDDDDSEDDENFDGDEVSKPSPTTLNLFKSRHDLKVDKAYKSEDGDDLPLSQSNLKKLPDLKKDQKIDDDEDSVEEEPFRPDDIRELFRTKVPGSVTAQLIISEILILVIGTSLGEVWICKGLNEEAFIEVDLSGLTKVSPKVAGSDHYVTGIVYSAYSWDTDNGSNPDGPALIPVVYVTFSCGNVAVICLQTSALVAYGLSEENEDRPSLQTIIKRKMLLKSRSLAAGSDGGVGDLDSTDGGMPKLAVTATVVDSAFEIIKSPKCRATYSSTKRVIDGAEVTTLSFITLANQEGSSSSSNQSPEQSSTRSRAASSADAFSTFRTPKSGAEDGQSNLTETLPPRYLLVAVWKSLVTYDIVKFSRLTIPVSGGRSKRSYSIATPVAEVPESLEPTFIGGKAGAQTSQVISKSAFITGNQLNFKNRSAPCLSPPITCLLVVNSQGGLTNTSIKHQAPLGDINLFTEIKSDIMSNQNSNKESGEVCVVDHKAPKVVFNSTLKGGVLLSNGSCYFLQKSGLIFNSCLSAENSHHLTKQAGKRHATNSSLIVPQMSLYSSQEQELKVSNCQSSLKNKQSSMFGGIKTGHSGPADLMKLFAKYRDANYVRSKDKFELNKSVLHVSSSMSNRDDNESNLDKSPKITRKNIFSVVKAPVGRLTDTVQNVMAENMKNMEERGEKLNRLSNQAEEVSTNAATFRDLARKHKNELDRRALNKWGGIL